MSVDNQDQPLGAILSSGRKLLVLFSLALVAFATGLSQFITTTAMPRVLADLGGFDLLTWVFTSYLLATTVAIPVVGRPSDMFGRKPFIIGGLIIFVVGSTLSGAAPSMLFLIGARTFQGVGAGVVTATVFAAIAELYTPIERAKYISYVLALLTVATVLGPVIGGFITDNFGWRWVFFLNIPTSIIAGVVLMINMPHTKRGGRLSSIDFAGAALLTVATVCLMLAIIWGTDAYGWISAQTIGLFAGAAVFSLAFYVQESRHPQAIFPTYLFRNRVFTHANIMIAVSSAAMFGAIVYLPTFFQVSLGASATVSGLISMPLALGTLAASVTAGQVIARTGRYKYQVMVGTGFAIVGAILMQTIGLGDPKWQIAALVVVFGLGSGLVAPTMSVIVQNSLPVRLTGVATSSRQFFRQIAMTLGVAILGIIFTTTFGSAFSANTLGQVQEELPTAIYERFEDATIALDEERFAEVRGEVLALPGGEALLDLTLDAQKRAGLSAIHRVFLVSMILALILLALAIAMKEIPLRRTFSEEEEQPEEIKAVPEPDTR